MSDVRSVASLRRARCSSRDPSGTIERRKGSLPSETLALVNQTLVHLSIVEAEGRRVWARPSMSSGGGRGIKVNA